jgi:hypothetical protein
MTNNNGLLVGKPPTVLTRSKSDSTVITSNGSLPLLAGDHAEHLILMLRDAFGFRMDSRSDSFGRVYNEVTVRFVELSHIAPIEKIMKWWYGNSLSWILGDQKELAPSPLGGLDTFESSLTIFGSSRVRRFLASLFRRASRLAQSKQLWKRKRALSIGQTLLQAKKGTPLVSEALVNEAELKHKKAITGSGLSGLRKEDQLSYIPGLLWSDVVESTEKEELMMKTIRGIVNELLPKGDYAKSLEHANAAFPSFSGYHSRTRSELGAVGEIASSARHFGGRSLGLSDMELDRMAVLAMRQTPVSASRLTAARHVATAHAVKIRSAIFAAAKRLKETSTGINEDALLRDSAKLIRMKHFDATPVFLREPLKVRTITKGPVFPYWVLKPLQQYLWGKLKSHATFQLVGTPMSSEILSKVFNRGLAGDEAFVSGDYSAATDNLKQWLSRYVVKCICERIGAPNWLRRLASKSLVGHRLHYEDSILAQVNGQLMGSPLSFPILCIVNAALCSAPLRRRREFKRCRLSTLPVLINGDDCGMAYTSGEYAEWKSLSAEAGMSPSVGKCYFSRHMIQLNSELYDYAPEKGFTYVPYLNFGLCSPLVSKGGEPRHWTSYGISCREFLRLAGAVRPETSDKLVSIWLRRMIPSIEKECPFNISWGLPTCLGGLGVPISQERLNLGANQLRLASMAYNKIAEGVNPRIVTKECDLPSIARQALMELVPFEEVRPGTSGSSSELYQGLVDESVMSPFLWRNVYDPATELTMVTSKASVNSFYRWMRHAREVQARLGDLHLVRVSDLLSVQGLTTEFPQGMSIAFGKILKPVALYAKLGAILGTTEQGMAGSPGVPLKEDSP